MPAGYPRKLLRILLLLLVLKEDLAKILPAQALNPLYRQESLLSALHVATRDDENVQKDEDVSAQIIS